MKTRLPRQWIRYPVEMEVLELNGRPVGGTRVLDLSAQGAKLETSEFLSIQQLVEFAFACPGLPEIIRLGGQVVWMRPAPSTPGRFLVGLRLLQPCWEVVQLARRDVRLADDH